MPISGMSLRFLGLLTTASLAALSAPAYSQDELIGSSLYEIVVKAEKREQQH